MATTKIRLWETVLLSVLCLVLTGPASAGCDDDREPGMDWSGCRKMHKVLDEEDFTGSLFHEANLSLSNLKESNFTRAGMIKVDLTRAKLDEARFEQTDLLKSVGYRASFRKARFNNSRMTKSEYSRADFSEAQFENIDWAKAELGRANFTGASFKEVNFEFSNLARARFTKANLLGVYFTKAYTYLTRLEGVDLSEVYDLMQDQLDMACGDDKTRLPEGLVMPASWPCGD